MIQTVFYSRTKESMLLVKTFSTEGKLIKQLETENEYDIAIDIGVEENGEYKPKFYTYEETDKPIKIEE